MFRVPACSPSQTVMVIQLKTYYVMTRSWVSDLILSQCVYYCVQKHWPHIKQHGSELCHLLYFLCYSIWQVYYLKLGLSLLCFKFSSHVVFFTPRCCGSVILRPWAVHVGRRSPSFSIPPVTPRFVYSLPGINESIKFYCEAKNARGISVSRTGTVHMKGKPVGEDCWWD